MISGQLKLPLMFVLTIQNHTLDDGRMERVVNFFLHEEFLIMAQPEMNITVTPRFTPDKPVRQDQIQTALERFLLSPISPLLTSIKQYYYQELSNQRFPNLLAVFPLN